MGNSESRIEIILKNDLDNVAIGFNDNFIASKW